MLASFAIFKQSRQMSEHSVVLSIVTVAGLGVGARWLAWRLKMPAIVLLAAVGLIMGPGLDLIHPSEDFGEFLRPVVSLCVAIILFEGGLSLQLRELKEAASGVRRLVYLGVPLAWSFSSLCAHYIGGLDWSVSLVFGAIMVVTQKKIPGRLHGQDEETLRSTMMPILRSSGVNSSESGLSRRRGYRTITAMRTSVGISRPMRWKS